MSKRRTTSFEVHGNNNSNNNNNNNKDLIYHASFIDWRRRYADDFGK
jgi:hypothetical protein